MATDGTPASGGYKIGRFPYVFRMNVFCRVFSFSNRTRTRCPKLILIEWPGGFWLVKIYFRSDPLWLLHFFVGPFAHYANTTPFYKTTTFRKLFAMRKQGEHKTTKMKRNSEFDETAKCCAYFQLGHARFDGFTATCRFLRGTKVRRPWDRLSSAEHNN